MLRHDKRSFLLESLNIDEYDKRSLPLYLPDADGSNQTIEANQSHHNTAVNSDKEIFNIPRGSCPQIQKCWEGAKIPKNAKISSASQPKKSQNI